MDFFVSAGVVKAPELREDIAEKKVIAVFDVVDVGVTSGGGAGFWCSESIDVKIIGRHLITHEIVINGLGEEVDNGAASGIANGPGFVIGQVVVGNVLIETVYDKTGGFSEASMVARGADIEIG